MTVPASRRRGAVLERAILDAAAAELADVGYGGLTMDRVALRAKTNKNAIYRRWPNRAALALAAYRELAARRLEPPDTGALRSDVLEVLRRINSDVDSPRAEVLRGLLESAAEDPELLQQLHRVGSEPELEPWQTILERAVARGEAAAGSLRPRVATVALVLLRNEYITGGMRAVPDGVLVEIVDQIYLPLVRNALE